MARKEGLKKTRSDSWAVWGADLRAEQTGIQPSDARCQTRQRATCEFTSSSFSQTDSWPVCPNGGNGFQIIHGVLDYNLFFLCISEWKIQRESDLIVILGCIFCVLAFGAHIYRISYFVFVQMFKCGRGQLNHRPISGLFKGRLSMRSALSPAPPRWLIWSTGIVHSPQTLTAGLLTLNDPPEKKMGGAAFVIYAP